MEILSSPGCYSNHFIGWWMSAWEKKKSSVAGREKFAMSYWLLGAIVSPLQAFFLYIAVMVGSCVTVYEGENCCSFSRKGNCESNLL